MIEIIAKRYVRALKETFNSSELVQLDLVFIALAEEFNNKKTMRFINNVDIDSQTKAAIFLDAIKPVNSKKLNNFINLLANKRRLGIIPTLSKVLTNEIAKFTNTYKGFVYSNKIIKKTSIERLSQQVSDKVNSNIKLEFIKNKFDGIKVEIEDLGLEIDFSQSKIDAQIIEHILKAI